MQPPIVLYDGVCGLCNGFVQFVLRRDHDAIFRFAALQSPLATRILSRHGVEATDLETVYVVVDFDPDDPGREVSSNEMLFSRSDAVQYVLTKLSVPWRAVGRFLGIIPRPLCDWGYRLVARNRYLIFGRYGTCPIPSPQTRRRFLDL